MCNQRAFYFCDCQAAIDIIRINECSGSLQRLAKKRFQLMMTPFVLLVEVIMLTAHATVESAIEGMKFGAFDYLMKPCDIEQLMGKVDEATRKSRDHEEKIREAHMKEILTKRGF